MTQLHSSDSCNIVIDRLLDVPLYTQAWNFLLRRDPHLTSSAKKNLTSLGYDKEKLPNQSEETRKQVKQNSLQSLCVT